LLIDAIKADGGAHILSSLIDLFPAYDVGIGTDFGTRREIRHQQPVELYEMRRRSFAAPNGDKPFFDLPAAERRGNDEHSTNGIRRRERVGYRFTNGSGVAPQDALN
jgi:hypothetical protein